MAGTIPENYIEAKLSVSREMADAVCNYIIDNITSGLVLEEEDESTVTAITFYVTPDKESVFRTGLPLYLSDVFGSLNQAPPVVQEKTIKNVEWVEEYKRSIQPVRIAEDIVVRPHWHDRQPETRFDIMIEPKMAFGTGTHETTRSCLAVIRRQFRSGMTFLDVGTGSGILSILAAQMGASRIKAIDYDVAAVNNARENFAINQISAPHEILFGSIERAEHDRPYDFVCANIIKSTILPMLKRLVSLTAPGGRLVLSGLLTQDEAETTQALIDLGQLRFEIVIDNKWLTYVVDRQ
ncbi:MAG: 50S ribosomal protein L11 methyltransferase [candidate division Zixibacteria bacterium]|nr:50S ribosomal protein L11 methyltransferase [candidate division Zixibacteria bacterium]